MKKLLLLIPLLLLASCTYPQSYQYDEKTKTYNPVITRYVYRYQPVNVTNMGSWGIQSRYYYDCGPIPPRYYYYRRNNFGRWGFFPF